MRGEGGGVKEEKGGRIRRMAWEGWRGVMNGKGGVDERKGKEGGEEDTLCMDLCAYVCR